jgi:Tfp pilus assembly protein PilV
VHSLPTSPPSSLKESGFTITEAIVATVIFAITFLGLFALNTRILHSLRATKETAAASQGLQERMEFVRRAPWSGITDETYISTAVLSFTTVSAANLPNLTERIIINSWPTASGSPLQLTRSAAGTVTVDSSNSALVNQKAIQVLIRYTWTGSPGRIRVREAVAIVGKAGIGK